MAIRRCLHLSCRTFKPLGGSDHRFVKWCLPYKEFCAARSSFHRSREKLARLSMTFTNVFLSSSVSSPFSSDADNLNTRLNCRASAGTRSLRSSPISPDFSKARRCQSTNSSKFRDRLRSESIVWNMSSASSSMIFGSGALLIRVWLKAMAFFKMAQHSANSTSWTKPSPFLSKTLNNGAMTSARSNNPTPFVLHGCASAPGVINQSTNSLYSMTPFLFRSAAAMHISISSVLTTRLLQLSDTRTRCNSILLM
mmetsp:Transcript_3661/g.9331  ORF Transcript_3661/g.9331 Transcript_3661/m.9331 type:complete len:253 (-) Transcript_3661:263-1021(-)